MDLATRNTSQSAEDFLDALASARSPVIAAHDLAVVIAHPDDETLGCGAQLNRLTGATIIVVTDGAPRRTHAVGDITSYASQRMFELKQALARANVAERNVVMLGFSDQTAAMHLVELTRTLYRMIAARDLHILLTHAYEGGHPDHDATCFAVHLAAALRRVKGDTTDIVEMPLYRAGGATWLRQSFVPDAKQVQREIRLDPEARKRKQSMLDAYASQRATLLPFRTDIEFFRLAPAYKFTALPNDGALLYERHEWGMTGTRWLELARDALRELGFSDEPCH